MATLEDYDMNIYAEGSVRDLFAMAKQMLVDGRISTLYIHDEPDLYKIYWHSGNMVWRKMQDEFGGIEENEIMALSTMKSRKSFNDIVKSARIRKSHKFINCFEDMVDVFGEVIYIGRFVFSVVKESSYDRYPHYLAYDQDTGFTILLEAVSMMEDGTDEWEVTIRDEYRDISYKDEIYTGDISSMGNAIESLIDAAIRSWDSDMLEDLHDREMYLVCRDIASELYGDTIYVCGIPLHLYQCDTRSLMEDRPYSAYYTDTREMLRDRFEIRVWFDNDTVPRDFAISYSYYEYHCLNNSTMEEAISTLESIANSPSSHKYELMVKENSYIQPEGEYHIGNIILRAFDEDGVVGYDTYLRDTYIAIIPPILNDLDQLDWNLVIDDTVYESIGGMSLSDEAERLIREHVGDESEHARIDFEATPRFSDTRGLMNSDGGWSCTDNLEVYWFTGDDGVIVSQIFAGGRGNDGFIAEYEGYGSLEEAKSDVEARAMMLEQGYGREALDSYRW